MRHEDPGLARIYELQKVGIRESERLAGRWAPVPRVHGNGFVQLDLRRDASQRLHIWGHPLIPSQALRSGIHDHTYTMVSQVLVGRIIDLSWIVTDVAAARRLAVAKTATHQVFEVVPRDGADTELVGTGIEFEARIKNSLVYGEGSGLSSYRVEAGAFHSSVTDGVAATRMTKIPSTLGREHRPRVLVPIGGAPDNEFNRNAHSAILLMGIIAEVLPNWLDFVDDEPEVRS